MQKPQNWTGLVVAGIILLLIYIGSYVQLTERYSGLTAPGRRHNNLRVVPNYALFWVYQPLLTAEDWICKEDLGITIARPWPYSNF